MKAHKLYSAVLLTLTASLLLSACAALAPAPTSTPLPPTKTPKPSATSTSTPKPTKTPLPTPTPNLAATQQVNDFAAVVKGYYDAGYVSTTNGKYTHLADVTYELSEINYYREWSTDIAPTDFVLKSDVTWDSASAAADSSGCGFVFREQPNSDEYMVYASLKGYVEATYYIGAKSKYAMSMGHGTFGNPAQRGKTTITLIAEGKVFRVLINDKLIKVFTGFDGNLMDGNLAYTVLSGTNKSFGTRCTFTNTELWTVAHE